MTSKHEADYNEQFTDVCPTCHGEGSVPKGELIALTTERDAAYTMLREAVVNMEYSEDDADGNHSYDRARQNEGYKYAQEDMLQLLDTIYGKIHTV